MWGSPGQGSPPKAPTAITPTESRSDSPTASTSYRRDDDALLRDPRSDRRPDQRWSEAPHFLSEASRSSFASQTARSPVTTSSWGSHFGPRRATSSYDFRDDAYSRPREAERTGRLSPFEYVQVASDRRLAGYVSQASPAEHKRRKQALSDPAREAISRYEAASPAPPPSLLPQILLDPFLEPRTYDLFIRQSPIHGQVCTLGSKDRRILDPLPIIELDMRDRYGKRDLIGQATPFLLMQVALITVEIQRGNNMSTSPSAMDISPGLTASQAAPERPVRDRRSASPQSSPQGESSTRLVESETLSPSTSRETSFPALRLLEGKLTASAQIARFPDARGQGEPQASSSTTLGAGTPNAPSSGEDKGCFFVFSDLSIRMRGTFRLQFSLVRLGAGRYVDAPGQHSNFGAIVAQIVSEPFQVVHARDFTGMTESTPLAKSLASQGIHIPIRNETRGRQRATQSSRVGGSNLPSS